MPDPLFILCPPRSYSSMVCAMLGEHPDCYGLPELNLFIADDLGGVWSRPSTVFEHSRDGLLRTLAQLHDGEQTEAAVKRAETWIEGRQDWPPARVFAHIQELVGAKVLIDKSPSTVMRPDNLARMYRTFPEASFLHLTRHPRSMCASMLRLTERSQAWGSQPADAAFDPERLWLKATQNILDFAAGLPTGQFMRIRAEELLANLDIYLIQIAEWLGIRGDAAAIEAMRHPERSPYACPGPDGAQYGNDPDFVSRPALDAKRLARIECPPLDAELEWHGGAGFSRDTLRLAKQFGYQ